MDTNFQTSFIPKKPLAEDRVPVAAHTSIFSFIATLIFFAALGSAAAMYFYQASLTKDIASKSVSLEAARNSLEPELLKTLQKLDKRITNANILLGNHIVVSPIFAALEINTLKSIQFTRFSYATPADQSAPVTIHMSGKGRDYASVALQSDQLAKNKNIHNSIFSNLALDEQTGKVSFDLVFTVDADLVRFTNHLDELVSQQGTATTPVTTTDTTGQTPATPPTSTLGTTPVGTTGTPQ